MVIPAMHGNHTPYRQAVDVTTGSRREYTQFTGYKQYAGTEAVHRCVEAWEPGLTPGRLVPPARQLKGSPVIIRFTYSIYIYIYIHLHCIEVNKCTLHYFFVPE
jgi:hypothetical protein